MTRCLVAGLVAEGPEDEIFLSRIAVRQLKEIGAASADSFEVQEQVVLGRCRTVADHSELCREVEDLAADCDLVLLHSYHRERRKIDSVRDSVQLPAERALTGVVPVRETEAWLPADAGLLGSVPGALTELLSTRPRDAEKVPDPKRLLAEVLPGYAARDLSEKLGDEADLLRLAEMPAYRVWRVELNALLKELHFL